MPSYDGLLGAEDYSTEEPEDWSRYGLVGFGYLVPYYEGIDGEGIIQGGMLGAEVDTDVYPGGTARTPLMELRPEDYQYMRRTGQPYAGMFGLGDDGQVYVYDGLGGFFKRLFRKVRRKVKKIGRRIRSAARKVLKRIPGGKFLIKVGRKIKKVAMKVIKPVTRFVGKYARKLAPVAAFIPGYGPAIAAGLRVAGRAANVARRFMGTDDLSSRMVFPQRSAPRYW